MNKTLHRFIGGLGILSFALTANAQVPGNPVQPNVTVLQQLPKKSEHKLSNELLRVVEAAKSAGINMFAKPNPFGVSKGLIDLLQIRDGKIVIDVTIKDNADLAKQQLQKAGAVITGVYGRKISALIPVNALLALEAASQVRFAQPAFRPLHQGKLYNELSGNSPEVLTSLQASPGTKNSVPALSLISSPIPAPAATVYSQGDTSQGSHIARKKFKADGKGVKIGILSDSYDNRDGASVGVTNGELPGVNNPNNYKKPVQVLMDMTAGGTDEGRAMAEIVHDVAPGAQIAFHTAYNGEASFAQGIIDLEKAGCKVITDDVYYFAEPFFQDGIIAQAIDRVVKKGATYFSSAGNLADKAYDSKYQPAATELFGTGFGKPQNFAAPGAVPVYFHPIFIPIGGSGIFSFQWDQPFYSAGGAGAESDLDIYLLDSDYNIVASGDEFNLNSGDPVEVFGFGNNTASTQFYIIITKYSGPDPSRLRYQMYNSAQFYSGVKNIPGQSAPIISGHANAAGAIATAAAAYFYTPAYGVNPPQVETFSSLGGVPILFDKDGNRIAPIIRKKPEITAPDGGNNSFFGNDDNYDTDKLPNFSGTSAAAPHAAAVAALMIDAQKLNTITPEQIKGILSTRTYDMDSRFTQGFDKGFDHNTGHGLIRAELAVGDVKFPNRYIKDLQLIPLCSESPSAARNWKIVNPNPFDVNAHWFLTGFSQDARPTVPPGETYFSTKAAYYRNIPVPNIVILDWEDNFGFSRFDIASSSTKTCKNNVATMDVSGSEDKAALQREVIVKPEVVEVFPNPSDVKFRLYLSLAKSEKTEISLYSADGRQLYLANVPGNGIHEIDAARYKPGVYLMKIRQGTHFQKTLKVIRK